MTFVLKNVHFNVLDDIVNKYTNTYQRTIKIKVNDKDPKFKSGDYVRITGLKTFLWLKKLKILFHGHILLLILIVKK